MKYSGLNLNDVVNGEGVCVSFFTQGCARHCKGCFNPETWDFNGGKDFTEETLQTILQAMRTNGIKRNLSILGGEPLHPLNLPLTALVIETVKEKYPETKVFIWTGYTYEELKERKCPITDAILNKTYCLIDGAFVEEEKDLTLKMRGSRNQRIIYLRKSNS